MVRHIRNYYDQFAFNSAIILYFTLQSLGGCLNIKMSSYQYRDPYDKDKTTIVFLTWKSSSLGKTIVILRWGPGLFWANKGIIMTADAPPLVLQGYQPPLWWRHQKETFSTWLAFCAGNSMVTSEFPAQRASNTELRCLLSSPPEPTDAGDLSHHHTHYDVIVLWYWLCKRVVAWLPWRRIMIFNSIQWVNGM